MEEGTRIKPRTSREVTVKMTIIKKTIKSCVRLCLVGWPRDEFTLTRYYMYRRLREIGRRLCVGGRGLAISGSANLFSIMLMNLTEVVEANYPHSNILALDFPDAGFDVVVTDQVLEHVEGAPQAAIDETLRVLRPGGLLVHTTCLINPIHCCPGDYWRFTPDGLRLLCQNQAEVIEAAGWGNLWVWAFVMLGLRFEPVPRSRWHPLHWAASTNHPNWPIATWVVAKKRQQFPA